jgi:prepilin-type N-terminal cleavage/methylation domain-containing protein
MQQHTLNEVMPLKPKTYKKDCTPSQGFTLVELMIVIAVIAALSTAAVLGAHSFMPRYRLNSACLDIIAAFQRARVSAIRNNAGPPGVSPQCVLVFQPVGTAGALPGGSYFAFMDTNSDWVENAGEVRVIPQKGMPHGVNLINASFINNNNGRVNAMFCCAYNSQGLATRAFGNGQIVAGNVDMQAVAGSQVLRVNFTATGRVSKQIHNAGGTWVDHS